MVTLGGIYYLYANNRENNQYVKPIGKLIYGDNEIFRNAVISYCQQDARLLCDVKVLGHDDRYLYVLLYRTWYENIHTANAKPGTRAADECRAAYADNPLRISDFQCMGDGNMNPSIQSLYPKKMYDSARKIWFSWISETAMDAKAKE